MQPLWNEAALAFDLAVDGAAHTYLALAELHIGFEGELARRGAFLKSRTVSLADRILALAKTAHADRLILLGDVKHRIGGLSPQERRDLPVFFDRLDAFDEVHVTIGNHDAGLRTAVPAVRHANLRYHPASGWLLRGDTTTVGCLHGHAWPAPELYAAETILASHTHVAFGLVDEQGRATTEWAWLRARLRPDIVRQRCGEARAPRVIIFPPFNPLLGGTAINRDGLLGPMARLVDWASSEVTLLDGRAVGSVSPPAPRKARRPRATRT